MKLPAILTRTDANIAVSIALLLPLLIGAGGIAVDLSIYHVVKGRLQSATDAAAMGAVRGLRNPNFDVGTVKATGQSLALANVPEGYGTVTHMGEVEVGFYDPSDGSFSLGASRANAVRVTAARDASHQNTAPRFLSRIFGGEDPGVSAAAIAVLARPQVCVLALDPNMARSINTSGNGGISAPGCLIHANSSNSESLYTSGSSSMVGGEISSVGGASGNFFTPTPLTGQFPIADPLASVSEPAIPSTCTTNNININSSRYFPGGSRFCGTTLITGNGFLTLGPGVHYFTGGPLRIMNSGEIRADGVMLYFGPNSRLDSASSGSVFLRAPQTGYYAGISIFQSRSTPSMVDFKMTGGQNYFLSGTVYAPRANLTFYGNGTTTVDSGYFITNSLSFTGNSTLVFSDHGEAVAANLAPHSVLVR